MDKITGQDFHSFIIVLAALVVFAGGVLGIVKNWRDLRKPSEDIVKWRKDTDTKLKNDNDRLNALEDANRVLCHGILAIMSHEITGNSIDNLRKAQKEMTDYLVDR